MLAIAMLRFNAQIKPDVFAPEIERHIRQSVALLNFPKTTELCFTER